MGGAPQQWPAYAGTRGAPAPGLPGAAHRPGAIPLRPLTLGSIYDGAFRIIRYNPGATVGAAALVSAVFMLIPVVVTSVTTALVGAGLDLRDPNPTFTDGDLISFLALFLGLYGAQLGLIFVTGMIAHVTRAAATGRRMRLGEAWAATHGKRWRLIGLTLINGLATLLYGVLLFLVVLAVGVTAHTTALTVVVAIAAFVAFVVGAVLFFTRVTYLSAVALMLEPVGVFGAIRRAVVLTRGQFWRTFGIAALTSLISGIAGGILQAPITIGGEVGMYASPDHALLIMSLMYAVGGVIGNAFVTPFKASVASLQYLDQRIRKEGYDVDLMREAGILAS